RDNGAGIPAEFLPYVFDRFRQADGSMTRQHGGLGLGLAIVREVTQAHGGQIRVESNGRGQGASFTLTLPLAPASAIPRETDGAIHQAASRLEAIRVLVVDDDSDAREVAVAALRGAGATVESAAGSDEGLTLARASRFDAVVCDIAMPVIDGYEFVRRLREADAVQGRFTPAVALSAFADRDAEMRARDAGFQ